jgi:uncharacterized protein with HEPN domain
MFDKNLLYIFTMLECIEKCWIYTKEFDSAYEFLWANEQKELNAVISMFIAIGEESKKIDTELKNSVSTTLKWSQIAGIRDKISHDYRGVDEDVLWTIVHNDLYELKSALLKMIAIIDLDEELIQKFLNSPYYKHIELDEVLSVDKKSTKGDRDG